MTLRSFDALTLTQDDVVATRLYVKVEISTQFSWRKLFAMTLKFYFLNSKPRCSMVLMKYALNFSMSEEVRVLSFGVIVRLMV